MKKRPFFLAALLIAALSLTACGNSPKTEDTPKPEPSQGTKLKTANTPISDTTFENFKIMKSDGTETELTNLLQSAELTVINIWDPSCESCKDEMKAFSTISGQYFGKGVQIVGVIRGITEKRNEDALAVIAETDANYVHLLDTKELDRQILSKYPETPTTLFLDRDGQLLADPYTGAKDQAFWEKEIEKYHSQVCENDHPADCATG